MKVISIFICVFVSLTSFADTVNLSDAKFIYEDSYVLDGWTFFDLPKLEIQNTIYSIVQGSDFNAICNHLGFISSMSYDYNPKSVIAAGFKARVLSDGSLRLIDEVASMDCFLGVCISAGSVAIPTQTFSCK